MTTSFLLLLAIIALVAVICALSVAAVLLLASLGAYFTTVAQATTRYINAGESLRTILPNIDNFKLSDDRDSDGQQWLIPDRETDPGKRLQALFRQSLAGTRHIQAFLWKRFGIRFISLWWPYVAVHNFDIRSIKTIKERSEVGANLPLRSRVADARPGQSTVVDELRFLVPRPVYIEGVELAGDNAKINLLLLPVYRQVIPALPVYGLKGDFFTLLDAAIEAAVIDFFSAHRVAVYKDTPENAGRVGQFAHDTYRLPGGRKRSDYEAAYEPSPLTYALWLKMTKAGENAPLEQHLRSLNVSAEYLEKLRQQGTAPELVQYTEDHLIYGRPGKISAARLIGIIPSGIVPRFGFGLMSFRNVEWEPHTSTEALAAALLAKETQLHTAAGVREQAYGVRDATMARAEGESRRFNSLVEALINKGVDPNVAAQVVQTQLRMENIRDSKLTTYVEGGASAAVMVPASGQSQTP